MGDFESSLVIGWNHPKRSMRSHEISWHFSVNSLRPRDIYAPVNYSVGNHRFRYWLVAWSSSTQYLNQSWLSVNWTIGNKFEWNLNDIQENEFDKVCKMSTILFLPQCVNRKLAKMVFLIATFKPRWPPADYRVTLVCGVLTAADGLWLTAVKVCMPLLANLSWPAYQATILEIIRFHTTLEYISTIQVPL